MSKWGIKAIKNTLLKTIITWNQSKKGLDWIFVPSSGPVQLQSLRHIGFFESLLHLEQCPEGENSMAV